MISWFGAAFLVFSIVVLIRMFGLVEKSSDVTTVARRSFGVIRNPDLNDDEKEAALSPFSLFTHPAARSLRRRATRRWTEACTEWPSKRTEHKLRWRILRIACLPDSLPRARRSAPSSSLRFPAAGPRCCSSVAQSWRKQSEAKTGTPLCRLQLQSVPREYSDFVGRIY